jgi:hypothetical protein
MVERLTQMTPLAASSIPAAPVVALMAFGVVVAIVGHATKLRWLVITGLALLFLATAGLFAGAFVDYHDNPNSDPRQERDYKEPAF